MGTVEEQFGGMDIYLFDQLQKGRITPGMSVLDAGCGEGRNLVYLLRAGYQVFAADREVECVEYVRGLAGRLNPALSVGNFRVEAVEGMSFPDGCADVVICNAVLHLAVDEAHFMAMLAGCWRVLKPGGMLFCRLASTIGMDGFEQIAGRRYRSPDGAERYLVDTAMLMGLTERLGGKLQEDLKTTVVEGKRAMTTWVVRKNG